MHARDDGLLFADYYWENDEDSGKLVQYPILGTSFAAPQVSAAAALLRTQHPTWSAEQVEDRLVATASDLGEAGRDDMYGYGLVDAAAAVGYEPSSDDSGGGSSGGSSGGTSGGSAPYWLDDVPTSPASLEGFTTAYAVRDGSAGSDFLGISNVNFDFKVDDFGETQYDGYTAADLHGVTGAGLALWATSVNENPNPYYVNLFYNTVIHYTPRTQAPTWLRASS